MVQTFLSKMARKKSNAICNCIVQKAMASNTIVHFRFIWRTLPIHTQWNSAYQTPMQENSCLKLPQISNQLWSLKNEPRQDQNLGHQMSLSKSKCWYSNNCLHFLKCTVPLSLSSLKKIHDIGTPNLSTPWMANERASSSNAKMRDTHSKTACSRKGLILTLMINQPILRRKFS